MEDSSNNTSGPAAKPSLVAALRARCAGLLGKLTSKLPLGRLWTVVRARPRLSLVVGGGAAVAMIGVMLFVTLFVFASKPPETPLTMQDALQALQQGDLAAARRIAGELHRADKLYFDERGGPAFIYGAAMARDAAENTYPEEQRRMYLIAARYLDTAYRQEYATSMTAEGLFLLGECWHHAGRYARALPLLTAALKRRPQDPTQVHRLLASAYYRDANPQYKLALAHLRKYLADRMLSPQERHAGQVEEARILLDSQQPRAAEEVLAKIPNDSSLASAVNVLKARLIMEQAAKQQQRPAEDPAPEDSPAARWQAALELLRSPPGRDATSVQAQREAQYLLGLCYLALEDYRAAEDQFSRARRLNLGMPEGLAAALEEADLARLQGKDEAAIDLYRHLLRDLGDLRDYSNPWLPLDTLRSRLLATNRYYRDADKHPVAIEFIKSLSPVLTEPRLLELNADVYRHWGERLATLAEAGPPGERASTLELARQKYHLAAEHYYRLARLSIDQREYPDYLWQSGECYELSHDFHRTIRVMQMFLEQNQRERRANALLAIAKSELALGNLQAALTASKAMLEEPKHPLSYRMRIVAHQIYLERNDFDSARRMLLDNLEHESLTPQSVEWRDSLFALGHVLARQGLELEAESRKRGVDSDDPEVQREALKLLEKSAAVFHEAMLRLSEALDRYPEDAQATEARYALAESYRHAAKWPRKRIPTISIESTRAALARQMQEELDAAHKLYGQLVQDLNATQDQRPLSPRESDILRNCYFLQADALFDLGRYDDAIAAYSSASNRYQQRPEALEALVQIAACYRKLDQPAKARGTVEQAKVVLRRIPEDADFAQTTRHERQDWITLLEFLSTL